MPIDMWCVIPFEVVKINLSLNLPPHLRGHKFAQYMEAWHLMSGDGARAKAREV